MKRIVSCILISVMLLFACCANAAVPAPSDELFIHVANALNLLATGAYDRVVGTIPFADAAPSADEWKSFAEGNFTTLNGATLQNKYIVLYWSGSVWKIAMPVLEPVNDDVEVLVLSSEDGNTFIGYGCGLWGDIRAEYESSVYVKWSEEYHSTTYALIQFDK